MRRLLVFAILLAVSSLIAGCGTLRPVTQGVNRLLHPPHPAERCRTSLAGAATSQGLVSAVMAEAAALPLPVTPSSADWTLLFGKAGTNAGLHLYQLDVALFPGSHDAFLAVVSWCGYAEGGALLVIESSGAVYDIGFTRSGEPGNLTAYREVLGVDAGWAIVNELAPPGQGRTIVHVQLIGQTSTGWGLLFGDADVSDGGVAHWTFYGPADFAFEDGFGLAITVQDPLQPFEDIYRYDDGVYIRLEHNPISP